MDRKKPPVLTSPWKVGFLVALMLIVTALGVGYFISGAFGLKWHWIELPGISPTQWTFRLDSFLEEMVPLIALVTLLAVASHLLVSGAVKRYRRFVDSGVEYKQLLKSIKTIEDLEDEERLEQLKQHPELREFLMGLKNRMAARERQASEREKRPAAPRETESATRNLAGESSKLLSAITGGKAGLEQDLGLSIPELKQIERAAREQFSKGQSNEGELESLRSRINSTVDAVKRHSAGIRRDTDACVNGLHEMEAQLTQLTRAIESNQEPAAATGGIATAAKQLDAMADAMATLGEETRRIAIAAALEASGGGEGESIKVAEEVRTIATRFNAVAAQWKQAGPALRTGIATIEKGGSSTDKRRKSIAAASSKVAAMAQKWGERLVALQEQIRELENAAGIETAAASDSRDWGAIDDNLDDYTADSTIETGGVEVTSDRYEAPAARPQRAPAAEEEADDDEGQFENAAPPHVFEESDGEDETQFADIPGFEKEQRVFNEQIAGTPGDEEPHDGLEVEPEHADVYGKAEAHEHEAPVQPAAPAGDDGFLTGPRGEKAAEPVEDAAPRRRPPIKIAPVVIEEEPAEDEDDGRIDITPDDTAPEEMVEEDADPDALDLYALGAVDYVEGVHA